MTRGADSVSAEGWRDAHEALQRGDYLAALEAYRRAVDDANPISFDPLAYILQALGRFADADQIRGRRAQLERHGRPTPQRLLSRVPAMPFRGAEQFRLVDAAERLVVAVRTHRLVILAEEHHHPEHRAFGARVLPALKAAGITHLAIEEGSQPGLDEAVRTRVVRPTSGGFTFEPQRAELTRTAIRSGLPIVAFDMDAEDVAWMQEHPVEAMAFRERRMAEHIVERILEPHPTSTVLVWVGYGHAYKRTPEGFPAQMMAQHLWRLSGDEPFAAYQLSPRPEGGTWRPGGEVDMVVQHPRPSYERGRPDWLRMSDGASVRGSVEPASEYLVQLHMLSEGAEGTPIDQLLTSHDGAFELLAPKGRYLLRVWSGAGRIAWTEELELAGDNVELAIRVRTSP